MLILNLLLFLKAAMRNIQYYAVPICRDGVNKINPNRKKQQQKPKADVKNRLRTEDE